MWPIIVTRSDHVTIWQSFWQNGDFDWLAVLKTILWLAVLFVLITSEFLRNIRLRNHAKSKFLATSVMTHTVVKIGKIKPLFLTVSGYVDHDMRYWWIKHHFNEHRMNSNIIILEHWTNSNMFIYWWLNSNTWILGLKQTVVEHWT